MTTTTRGVAAAGISTDARTLLRRPSWRTVAPSALALLGSLTIVVGLRLPWVTTFDGLLTQSGLPSRNGFLLEAAAAFAASLAVLCLARPSIAARWLLAITGFAMTAFSGYLLIQLYGLVGNVDTMALPGKGPGLFVVVLGASLVFGTVFAPMSPTTAGASVTPALPAQPSVDAGAWTNSLGSPWRYSAALLAAVAGLAHVPVTPAHLAEAPYVGASFIAFTAVTILLATCLLLADSPLVWFAIGLTCCLAVLTYAATRVVAFPLIGDDVGNWLEPLGVLSVLTEGSVTGIAALVLRRWSADRASRS